MDKTYEMLWDCKFCGAKKLLGLSHRFCPSCGAPQDAAGRYFPPDSERVAVEDHEYVGRDVTCPSCRDVNSRSARHCAHCGGPLEAAKDVGGVVAAPAPKISSGVKSRWPRILLAILGVGILLLLVNTLWKEDVTLTVKARSWTRAVEIEQFGPTRESAWCDRMPGDARGVTRTRKERSTKRVEDGETCSTRKVDNGDGTYREVNECRPKYRDEPVLDDHCSFTVDRWSVARTAESSGKGAEAPAWPAVGSLRAGRGPGSEREGARRESYEVQLADAKGKGGDCKVDGARFELLVEGTRWLGERRGLTGGILCDTLKKAP